ncbi:MAG: hemerythrin domain-containing protein [Rhodocyclaceae bacterium]|jgi:hemerythrin-like domain-containing protein|nr:hemerythrin domain-containing protein [Rhodocyclaceae bacterium]
MSDVLITPAPSFDEPVEMISACHGRLDAQLDTLRRLAAWLPEHGADEAARQAATAILRYFRVAGIKHKQDEEEDIFPRLLERVGADERRGAEGLVRSLLADHRELDASWAELESRLAKIQLGQAADLPGEAAAYFIQQYRNHIQCEEGMLLPLVKRVFSEEDLMEIGGRMSQRRRGGVTDWSGAGAGP